jgi:hypothetical protein
MMALAPRRTIEAKKGIVEEITNGSYVQLAENLRRQTAWMVGLLWLVVGRMVCQNKL